MNSCGKKYCICVVFLCAWLLLIWKRKQMKNQIGKQKILLLHWSTWLSNNIGNRDMKFQYRKFMWILFVLLMMETLIFEALILRKKQCWWHCQGKTFRSLLCYPVVLPIYSIACSVLQVYSNSYRTSVSCARKVISNINRLLSLENESARLRGFLKLYSRLW